MVTTIKVTEGFNIPSVENPSEIEFQVKRMINTSINNHIVSGLKDAYREFKIDEDGRLLEKQPVHDSLIEALNKDHLSDRKWVETSMDFEAVVISTTTDHTNTHVLKGSNGVVESIRLVSKQLDDEELESFHNVITDRL